MRVARSQSWLFMPSTMSTDRFGGVRSSLRATCSPGFNSLIRMSRHRT